MITWPGDVEIPGARNNLSSRVKIVVGSPNTRFAAQELVLTQTGNLVWETYPGIRAGQTIPPSDRVAYAAAPGRDEIRVVRC